MRRQRWRPHPRGGRAQAGTAIVEFVWLGLLLLLPLVYIVLSVFAVQRASYGVTAASRSAGRAFVLSPDQHSGYLRAAAAARVALADQGVHRDTLSVSCRPDPGECLTPGALVTVTVTAAQPLPLMPSLLGHLAPSVRVSGTHVEPYGTFRQARP